MESNQQAQRGLGLPIILFLIFMILKLCNVIDWSWWWVFSPIWITFVFVTGFIFLYGFFIIFRK